MRGQAVLFSSARVVEADEDEADAKSKDDWCTPEWLLDRVRLLSFSRRIALDPCSNPGSLSAAESELYGDTSADDGLALDWHGRFAQTAHISPPRLVYVNPPYSQARVWAAKCAAEAAKDPAGEVLQIVALVPARTDTLAWHDSVVTARAILFFKGRIRFLRPDGTPVDGKAGAPFPSALAYWGKHDDKFQAVFGDCGWVAEGACPF